MDIFITVIDADDQQPITIRVGNIGSLKRIEPTASSDPDMGAYTRIEMATDSSDYIRAVETVDQILKRITDVTEAHQRLIAGVNMATSTSAMGEVMKVVKDLMPLIRGAGTKHEAGEATRRNCTSCRHKAVEPTEEPCRECRTSNNFHRWEQE